MPVTTAEMEDENRIPPEILIQILSNSTVSTMFKTLALSCKLPYSGLLEDKRSCMLLLSAYLSKRGKTPDDCYGLCGGKASFSPKTLLCSLHIPDSWKQPCSPKYGSYSILTGGAVHFEQGGSNPDNLAYSSLAVTIEPDHRVRPNRMLLFSAVLTDCRSICFARGPNCHRALFCYSLKRKLLGS